jgi:hypothetical protein
MTKAEKIEKARYHVRAAQDEQLTATINDHMNIEKQGRAIAHLEVAVGYLIQAVEDAS